MQRKQIPGYIVLACMILLSTVVLLIGVWAQVPQQSQIAFHSDRDGNYEVYVMDANGGNPRNLTNHPASDYNPAWSPDGKKLFYDSERYVRIRTGAIWAADVAELMNEIE